VPWAATPMILQKDSGWIFGKIAAGTPTWIQNAGFAWVLSLVPLGALCWFGMNNLKSVSPHTGSPDRRLREDHLPVHAGLRAGDLHALAVPAGADRPGAAEHVGGDPAGHRARAAVMKLAAFGDMKEGVKKQFAIFRDKHTWSLTALYIVTFGSFIGFSMALPLAITVIFGFQHVPDANGVMQHTLKNPNAPSALTYAWIGPFVGAATRPIGGWISDKVGGSIVTQVITAVMALAAVAVGYVMMLAYGSATPEQYFPMFLGCSWCCSCQRHRQRLDLPHHRRHLRPHAGRPGAGLDLGGGRLRRLRRAGADRRIDQGRHAAAGVLRVRGVLRRCAWC
jgi:NNP family nitrate/nitrite transporter-like MFS transporter